MKKIISWFVALIVCSFVIHKIDEAEYNKKNLQIIDNQLHTIDSLRDEIDVMVGTIDYKDWIIDQATEKYPKEMGKIISDSE